MVEGEIRKEVLNMALYEIWTFGFVIPHNRFLLMYFSFSLR
jgi:hypothetical protein